MPLDLTLACDCQTIQKTFERGCHFDTTEASVYAMITPILAGIQGSATAAMAKWGQTEELLSDNVTGAIEKNNSIQAIKDCIPCDFRISFKIDLHSGIVSYLADLLATEYAYFKDILGQMERILDLFNLEKNAVDMCILKKSLSIMCIPDLKRIIAALMSLLMSMAFEFSSMFDMIFSLVAPLMLPFFLTLVNPLQKFFLLIIKPLECVINNISRMIDKLDYSQLFDMSSMKLDVSIGPQGKYLNTPEAKKAMSLGAPEGLFTWGGKTNINPFQTAANAKQDTVNNATTNLAYIQSQASNIDPNDIVARQKYTDTLNNAIAARNKAIEDKTSAIGQTSQKVKQVGKQITSFLWSLMAYIRQAIDKFTAWQNSIIGEVMKILQTFSGSSGKIVMNLQKKLAIVQIIAVIQALIKWLGNDMHCETPQPMDWGPTSKALGLIITKDADGTNHIIEDPNSLKGLNNLPSVIKLTGDQVLDTTTAKIVSNLTTPQSVYFKCPLQTNIDEAQKVNKWIEELSTN